MQVIWLKYGLCLIYMTSVLPVPARLNGIQSLLHYNLEEMTSVNNSVKCGQTKVHFTKTRFVYNWEIKGLLNYLDYVYNFGQNFTLESENISFSSMAGIDGHWKFKLEASPISLDPSLPINSALGTGTLGLTAQYVYEETSVNENMNVGLQLDLILPLDRNSSLHKQEFSPPASLFVRKPTRKLTKKIQHKSPSLSEARKTSPMPSTSTSSTSTSSSISFQAQRRRIFPSWFTGILTQDDGFDDDLFFSDNAVIKKSTSTSRPILSELIAEQVEYYETTQIQLEFDMANIQNQIQKLRQGLEGIADVHFVFSIFIVYPYKPIMSHGGLVCSIPDWNNSDSDLLKPAVSNSNIFTDVLVQKMSTTQSSTLLTLLEGVDEVKQAKNRLPPFVQHLESNFNFTQKFFEFADIELVVEDVHIPAHRLILANSSPTLSSLVQKRSNANYAHNNSGSFPVIEIDARIGLTAIQFLLEYLYTGKLNTTRIVEHGLNTSEQLALSGHLFGLPELKEDCETILLELLNVKNAIWLYTFSKDINSAELAKRSIVLIRQNKHSIISEEPEEFQLLLTKYPTLIFELFMAT